MRLDVERSATLVAAIRLVAAIPNEVAKQIRQRSKRVIQPEWKSGLAEHAPGDRIYHSRLVGPSAAYITDRGVRLRAGKAGKFPRETEFGASQETYTEYTRRTRSGGTARVRRRTKRQFGPYRRKGHVVYPTASEMIPRVAALWVQTIIRTAHEQIEKIR